jgi:hypothetical protein
MSFVVKSHPRRRASQLYPRPQEFNVSLLLNASNTRDISRPSNAVELSPQRMLL